MSVEEVQRQTGFPLVIPDEVPTTPRPSAAELEVLRTRVDSVGALRKA